jgi:hypothetical protein
VREGLPPRPVRGEERRRRFILRRLLLLLLLQLAGAARATPGAAESR